MNSWISSDLSTSPPHSANRNEGRTIANSFCCKNNSIMYGTKMTCVIIHVETRFLTYIGSLCPPGLQYTREAPATQGIKCSKTDGSKESEVCCKKRSPTRIGKWFKREKIRLLGPSCELATPFGRPVDPDV